MKSTQQYGFTLIEMMIVVAIIAIIAAWAIPSFSRQISHQALQKGASEIKSVFDQARSEAALSNKPATIDISNGNRRYEISFLDRSAGTGTKTTKSIELDQRLTVGLTVGSPPVSVGVGTDTQVAVMQSGQIDRQYVFIVCDTRIRDVTGYQVTINTSGIARQTSFKCS